MKKLLAIVLLAAVALTLWGCTPVNDGQASEEALTSTLASIQEMTEKSYDSFNLTVTTKKDDITLKNQFKVRTADGKTTVSYTVESLNKISVENGALTVPDNMIKVSEGKVEIADGKTVLLNGEAVDINLESVDKLALQFKASYFESPSVKAASFFAKVTNPKAFTQNSAIDAQNMTVSVSFNTVKLQKLTLKYNLSTGESVTAEYMFL